MKKIILTLVTLILATSYSWGQSKMVVEMKDGSTLNLFTNEIEQITWDYASGQRYMLIQMKDGTINSINVADINSMNWETAYEACPDEHHPHAIDLGLPSGIKWCCMNVGAFAPEEYGGYYAWGETNEKSEYTWETYAYFNRSTWEYEYIGSDIAGTSYDVAHVKMGGSWVMPSLAQQQELLDNCSWKWTGQNGVSGMLVTGPNGGSIFLPAAGNRWPDFPDFPGSYGSYWSSSFDSDYSDQPDYLFFHSDARGWYFNFRVYGQSVRAVCP